LTILQLDAQVQENVFKCPKVFYQGHPPTAHTQWKIRKTTFTNIGNLTNYELCMLDNLIGMDCIVVLTFLLLLYHYINQGNSWKLVKTTYWISMMMQISFTIVIWSS